MEVLRTPNLPPLTLATSVNIVSAPVWIVNQSDDDLGAGSSLYPGFAGPALWLHVPRSSDTSDAVSNQVVSSQSGLLSAFFGWLILQLLLAMVLKCCSDLLYLLICRPGLGPHCPFKGLPFSGAYLGCTIRLSQYLGRFFPRLWMGWGVHTHYCLPGQRGWSSMYRTCVAWYEATCVTAASSVGAEDFVPQSPLLADGVEQDMDISRSSLGDTLSQVADARQLPLPSVSQDCPDLQS